MGILSRLFGREAPEPPATTKIKVDVEVSPGDFDDELAVVWVGDVAIDAQIYRAYQRDVQDWSSGIRLNDPVTGAMLRSDVDFPAGFRAAGARSVAVVGLPHHPESQSPAFQIGATVRLVADPRNPVDRNAIAVMSADGRRLCGYVPADDLDWVRSLVPPARVGLVVWERWTWRPRVRTGLRLLIGPSVRLEAIPHSRVDDERARREHAYVAGREAEGRAYEMAREARDQERAAAKAAAAAARQHAREQRATEHEQAEALAEQRQNAGVCVECGGEIERSAGRGRPPIRCASCRAKDRR